MKKSEELKAKADQEENDLIAMGIYKKSMREARMEHFVDDESFKKLSDKYLMTYDENSHKFTIDTSNTKFKSIIDFYPKANKVLIRKENKWIKPGLKWIIKNLLK